MKYSNIIFALTLVLFLTCDNGTFDAFAPQTGAYFYQAFDTTGTAVIEGWLRLDLGKPENNVSYLAVSGKWQLSKIGDPENIGPQLGDGKLQGTIEKNKIWLDLNPGWADNNVFLNGTIAKNQIEGFWNYSTFVGSVNGGQFTAVRLREE